MWWFTAVGKRGGGKSKTKNPHQSNCGGASGGYFKGRVGMKEKILAEMESYFGKDERRIRHARRVLGFAEEILKTEKGDEVVVAAAAILHDIGIHAAEKKHGSSAGKYQQIEGPPIASHILNKIGFPKDKIPEILGIIAHHHTPGVINTLNFKILYDADRLVNLPDEFEIKNQQQLERIIDKTFLTVTGKKLAGAINLKFSAG